MKDWGTILDKFLRDNELPVLADAGGLSREDAVAWAEGQYEEFSDRRRLAAEAEAEARYLEDLRASARVLSAQKKKSARPKRGKKG